MKNFYVIQYAETALQEHNSTVDAVKNFYTQNNCLAEWFFTTDLTATFFMTKRLGKQIADVADHDIVIVAIGVPAGVTAVLNGLIAARRTNLIPFAGLDLPADAEELALNSQNLIEKGQSLLQVQHATTGYLAHVVGDLPHRSDRFFRHHLTIGISLDIFQSAANPTSHINLYAQLKAWSTWIQQFNLQTSFPAYIGLKDRYLSHPKSLTMRLVNHPERSGFTALVVDKMNFVGMFLAYWQLRQKKEPANIHGFAQTEFNQRATIHVADIQVAEMDGVRVGTGTFAFTIESYPYPFWS